MDSKSWLLSATFGVIIGIPLLSMIAYLVREQLQAHRNRAYKTLEDHTLLNASDREIWTTGELPIEEDVKLDLLGSRIVPLAQLATVAVLAAVVLVWNGSLIDRDARLEERMSALELQIHALALTQGGAAATHAEQDQQAAILNPPANGTPMQQVCANLIGRVADAYSKGESSKIGQSLEELVNKMGCQKILAPP